MPLPTLDDFKRHLNVTGTSDDAELVDVLAAAVDVVEGIVGPLRGQAGSETHRGMSSDVIILRRRPVVSLDAVAVRSYPGTASTPQALTALDLDADAGLLRMADGYPFLGDVTVTYTAGFDTVPQAVWLAALIVGENLWQTQRGAQPLPLQGGQDQAPVDVSYAPGIPARALALLEPYSRKPQVA